MKTKYKFIEFLQYGENWACWNWRDEEQIGYVEYCVKWKEWEYIPFENTGYTHDCLTDISHFLQQLNAEKESNHE